MRSKLPTGRQVLWTIAVGSLLVALAVFIFLGYLREWQWTGFPPKKLFDWMQILVIPVAVAIGTFVLNRAAKRRDDEAQQAQKQHELVIEAQHAEEASLRAYLDYISRLLTDPDRPLHRSHWGDNLSVVARAQTLTALGRLKDGGRKAVVLKFLYEAALIERNRPIIGLQGANLQGADLQGNYLRGAYLRGALLERGTLREANLQEATLREAYLQGVDLQGANLQRANIRGSGLERARLIGANLQEARLIGANLQEARLQEATLRKATLQRATLGEANLQEANLQGANLQGANLQEANLQRAANSRVHSARRHHARRIETPLTSDFRESD
jgi:uncharacterized protein YjbI with pentapeptide repeats